MRDALARAPPPGRRLPYRKKGPPSAGAKDARVSVPERRDVDDQVDAGSLVPASRPEGASGSRASARRPRQRAEPRARRPPIRRATGEHPRADPSPEALQRSPAVRRHEDQTFRVPGVGPRRRARHDARGGERQRLRESSQRARASAKRSRAARDRRSEPGRPGDRRREGSQRERHERRTRSPARGPGRRCPDDLADLNRQIRPNSSPASDLAALTDDPRDLRGTVSPSGRPLRQIVKEPSRWSRGQEIATSFERRGSERASTRTVEGTGGRAPMQPERRGDAETREYFIGGGRAPSGATPASRGSLERLGTERPLREERGPPPYGSSPPALCQGAFGVWAVE